MKFLSRFFAPQSARAILSFLAFSLLLFLGGCGSSFDDAGAPTPTAPQGLDGRSFLVSQTGADVISAIDSLPSSEALLIYNTVGRWSDSNPTLSGTRTQAANALSVIVRQSGFGAPALYEILKDLQPDNGQGFVVSYGQTLAPGDEVAVARTSDSLDALEAASLRLQAVDPVVEANLSPEISSMAEFHGLRPLDPAALTTGKRGGMQNVRQVVPTARLGASIRKVIKVADMESYLDGTFDPEVSGSVAVLDQTDFLVTPAQLIAGLRLDYPGGFSGETQVAELVFPQLPSFELLIPFSAAMGGVRSGDYPFTGNGFTSNLTAQTVPEFIMPLGPRTPLPDGTQLSLVEQDGRRVLQATLNQGVWLGSAITIPRQLSRRSVARTATYKGVPIWVSSTDGKDYWVACQEFKVGDRLFEHMRQVGPREFLGRIDVNDPKLVFEDTGL